jgi:N-acetyl-anhydromuramyl-L-alanine amidase AmpD
MLKINTEFLLPKKYYDSEMIPKALIWHGMSAKNAHEISLPSDDPFDVGVNIAILKHYGLSAHGIIARDGTFYQLVPWSRKARHAGVSLLGAEPNCNDWSIGIEFLTVFKTTKEHGPAFTPEQIKTGLAVRDYFEAEMGITQQAGHDEVRAAARKANMRNSKGELPDVKPDPGKEFPWHLFRKPKNFNAPEEVRATQEKILDDRRAAKARNQTVPVMPDGS